MSVDRWWLLEPNDDDICDEWWGSEDEDEDYEPDAMTLAKAQKEEEILASIHD